MKNLLFYTFHNQFHEILYSSLFFNKSEYLKTNFDVFLHCNNCSRSHKDLNEVCKFDTNSNILITSKNSGYQYGGLEATSDCFEIFKQYDTVIQLHPDCYIVDCKKIKNLLTFNFDISIAPFVHNNRVSYATDFFVFKIKNNFLSSCHHHWKNNSKAVPEEFIYDTLQNLNLNILHMDRYPVSDASGFREIDKFGIWHEHNIANVKKYLNV